MRFYHGFWNMRLVGMGRKLIRLVSPEPSWVYCFTHGVMGTMKDCCFFRNA